MKIFPRENKEIKFLDSMPSRFTYMSNLKSNIVHELTNEHLNILESENKTKGTYVHLYKTISRGQSKVHTPYLNSW